MSEAKLLKLSFENGLLKGREPQNLPAGFATELQNWVPEPSGGVRARRGWNRGSVLGAPSTRKGRGMGSFTRRVGPHLAQWTQVTVSSSDGYEYVDCYWPQPTTVGNTLLLAYTGVAETVQPATGGFPNHTDWGGAKLSASYSLYKTVVWVIQNSQKVRNTFERLYVYTGGNIMGSAYLFEYTDVAEVSWDVSATYASSNSPGGSITTGTKGQNREVVLALGSLYSDTTNTYTATVTQPMRTIFQGNVLYPGTTNYRVHHGVWDRYATTAGAETLTWSWPVSGPNTMVELTLKSWYSGTETVDAFDWAVAAHEGSSGHELYALDLAQIDGGTWTSLGTVTTQSPEHHVAFARGLGIIAATSRRWGAARYWNGLSLGTQYNFPAARTVAFHKSRFWVGGANGSPQSLWYSETGSYKVWPTTNQWFVGRDDGAPIEDICSFQEGLAIAKSNGLYFLTGNSYTTFTLNDLAGGDGAPGRCICPTPYGVVFAGRRNIWFWSGTGVESVTRPTEGEYELTGNFVSTVYIDGVVYIVDAGSQRVFCFDVANGLFWQEDVDNGPAVVSRFQDYLLFAPNNSSIGSLLNYRLEPAGERIKDFDDLTETFVAQTSEVWPGGPNQRVSPLHLHLRVKQRGGDSTHTPVTVTPFYDGEEQPSATIELRDTSPTTFRTRLDVGWRQGVGSVMFRFEQTLPPGEASLVDLDDLRLELLLEEKA